MKLLRYCTLLCVCGISVLQLSIDALAQKPTAKFDASPLVGCAPLTVFFNDQSSDDVIDWQWDFNNDGVYDDSGPLPNYTYTTPGAYSVRLMVYNFQDSATVTRTKYIVVTNPITINVPPPTVCANDSFRLKATVSGGLKPYQYFWSCTTFPNNSADVEPLVAVDTTQTWTLDIVDSLGCTATTSFQITVHPLPQKPAIIHTWNQLSCTINASSYQWFYNGSTISGATQKTYTVDTTHIKSGYYQVQVKNQFGCTALSDSIDVMSLTAIEDDYANVGWSLYPNPTHDIAYLSCAIPSTSILSSTIYSSLGFNVGTLGIDERSGRLRVPVSELPSGVYFISVTESKARHVFRLVKE